MPHRLIKKNNQLNRKFINPNAHQALQILRPPVMPAKSYFIRHMISQGLFSTAEQLAPAHIKSSQRWVRYVIYAASILTILTTAIFWGRDFKQSMLLTYSIQNNLSQYQLAIQQPNQDGDHLLKALPLLNALHATASRTNSNLSRLANLLSFYSDKSQKTATAVYQQALQTIIIPEVKNLLEHNLKNSNDKNSAQTYAALKAYLMLGDSPNLQIDYVLTVLKQLLPASINPQTLTDLTNHIHVAFAQSQTITLNNDLIEEVRRKLLNLTPEELGFVILKNMNNNNSYSPISMGNTLANTPVFVNKQITNQIPILFTARVFSDVTSQEIPVAASEALQGNWILGKADVLSNEATINALAEQLRSHYIANYVDIWESQLANLKLITPTSLTQTDAIIASLMSNTSPLLQLLNTIKQNTSFAPVMSASPKLQSLNALLANANNVQENTLYQIFVNLRQLHFYLESMLTSANVGQAAFDAAKARMQDPLSDPIAHVRQLAADNPEPMKSWLNNLATQSWYFVLQEASHYIEQAWQVNILTIYHSEFSDPNQDVDIQQLSNFVGKQGTLASFYERYLKLFANEDNKQWRMIDNQKLPFSNNVLAQIREVLKLQNMSKYALFTQARKNPALQHLQLPEKLDEKI